MKEKLRIIHFLGVRLLTQSIAPTTKEAPMSKAVIGAACVLQAMVTKEIQCRHRDAVSLNRSLGGSCEVCSEIR